MKFTVDEPKPNAAAKLKISKISRIKYKGNFKFPLFENLTVYDFCEIFIAFIPPFIGFIVKKVFWQ